MFEKHTDVGISKAVMDLMSMKACEGSEKYFGLPCLVRRSKKKI